MKATKAHEISVTVTYEEKTNNAIIDYLNATCSRDNEIGYIICTGFLHTIERNIDDRDYKVVEWGENGRLALDLGAESYKQFMQDYNEWLEFALSCK